MGKVRRMDTHLPRQERLLLDDRRLNDLLPRKDTLRHRISLSSLQSRPKITLSADNNSSKLPRTRGGTAKKNVTNHVVPGQEIHDPFHIFDCLFQLFYDIFAHKELHKRLLVHVSASRAPADDTVIRLQAVDRRLGSNGPPPVLGQAEEMGEDELRLTGKGGGRE